MSQNYGVLRVVRVMPARSSADGPDARNVQAKYPAGWLPEEGLVHVLTHQSTTIGRALNNDIILMDPTVSREHARLVLDQSGWHIINLTAQNVVRINGRPVPGGNSLLIQPQDILVLGNTMLQLIAPSVFQSSVSGSDGTSHLDDKTEILPKTHVSQPTPFNSMIIEKVLEPFPSSFTPPVPLQQHPSTAWMQEPASSGIQDGARDLDDKHAKAFTPPNLSVVPGPLDPDYKSLPRFSNRHSTCGMAFVPSSAVSSLGGFRTSAPCARPHRHGAGIRNPSQTRTCGLSQRSP